MESIKVEGYINEQHQLSADVPGSIPPGPVTIWIAPTQDEDEGGSAWMDGIAREWGDELSDKRQDIYTSKDGEPVG